MIYTKVPNNRIVQTIIPMDTYFSFSHVAFSANYAFQLESASQTNINAISTPTKGMMAYNNDDNKIYYYDRTSWINPKGRGLTRLDYAADLPLTLTDTHINNNIKAASIEGKQRYHSSCEGVIHHNYNNGNYNYTFGFRLHNNKIDFGQQTYQSTNISVLNDDCIINDNIIQSTDFDIIDIQVPIINIHPRDNSSTEEFGSSLTNYQIRLR